ncbi:hypothetical protein BSKO_13400 [Bryopsis sp. KO-2023]|nr:hypothetical protein BSKO_13400 [Bryopsis sp. KO-2023]
MIRRTKTKVASATAAAPTTAVVEEAAAVVGPGECLPVVSDEVSVCLWILPVDSDECPWVKFHWRSGNFSAVQV